MDKGQTRSIPILKIQGQTRPTPILKILARPVGSFCAPTIPNEFEIGKNSFFAYLKQRMARYLDWWGSDKVDPHIKNTPQTRTVILRTPFLILSWNCQKFIFCIFYDIPSHPEPDICIWKKKCPAQNDQLIESYDSVYSVFWPLEKKKKMSFFFFLGIGQLNPKILGWALVGKKFWN